MNPDSESANAVDTATGVERLLHRRWLLVIGAWSVPALLAAFETFAFWRMAGREYPFWRAIVLSTPAWMTYALLTPAIFALARRLPLQRPHLWRNIALHLLCSLTFALLYAVVAAQTSILFTPMPRSMPFGRMAMSWYLSALPLTTLAYFGVVGVAHAFTYLADARRREMESARLAAQLAEARLGALRMQLHPHFLFNTLNAITVLARDGDTRAVARMLTLLGELLREVLRTDAAHKVSLNDELAFVARYLEIEQVRFADRLTVRYDVADAARSALVPVFLLQPLVENALRHGLAPRAAGGTVVVGARLAGELLELHVQDDGMGLPPGWRNARDDYGIGLSNTAARLRELYGDRASLRIERAADGTTHAMVRMPRETRGLGARDAPAAALADVAP